MPYIKTELRNKIDSHINALTNEIISLSETDTDFAGILNYSISSLISGILLKKFEKLRYWHSPLIRGVLMDVADEFYRRIIVPYEDKQINKSGDVNNFINLNNR